VITLQSVLGQVVTAGGTKYPNLPAALAQAFTTGFGDSPGPLNADRRTKLITVCRDLAAAFAKV
jgi:hypothetical protein